MLRLDNIEIAQGQEVLGRAISFRIGAGTLGCLLGPSGEGKTTLLRAISGLHPVRAGTITLGDRVFTRGGCDVIPCHQRGIGFVPQEPTLYPHLTVAGNLGFVLPQLSRHERRNRVISLLEATGLRDKARALPHELSGGQAQRVALARALAVRPRLLLLDEPFSSLHSELAAELSQAVVDAIEGARIPALMITHDRAFARAKAGWVGELRAGGVTVWDPA